VAVFIDGCFWHGCSKHYRPAKRNADFWSEKIKGNMARDIDTDTRLTESGWRVVRVWEHESPIAVAERIKTIVQDASSSVD
jgi:DNA mismatch endonuclease (patch repair protein)